MKRKKETKICGLCSEKIIIPGEEYCAISQYGKDEKFYKEGHYHIFCFKKYLVNNQADEIIQRTMKVLQKAEEKFA